MTVLVSVIVILLLVAAVGGFLWWRRARQGDRAALRHASAPPIVVLPADQHPTRQGPAAAADRAATEGAGTRPRERSFAPPAGAAPLADAQDGDAPLVLTSVERDGGPGLADMPRPTPVGVRRLRSEADRSIRPHPGMAAVALATQADVQPHQTGTLRMLPGRLEVVSGLPSRAEIRLVQTGASAEQQVTIGRQEGRPYEHVQLASQTVSRLHALLRFQRGRWLVANLSETNPLRVNGMPLERDAGARLLADGDLLELGEVVLRYRQ